MVPAPASMPAAMPAAWPDAAATRRSSGLAVGALVCGILGLIGCFPVGVVGLVLGIVALVRIGNQPARHGGKGMAIGGICTAAVGMLLLPLLVAIGLPSLARARELSKRTVCRANMMGIGQALYIYAQDEPKGMFPEAGADWMGRLTGPGHVTPMHFVCPSTADMSGDCSYIYVPGYGTSSNPAQIILYEPPENHGGEGGNILYLDGHVSFVKSPQYEQAIAAITLPDGSAWSEPNVKPEAGEEGKPDESD